ncbi:MAG: TIGR00153 family protein, partial [Rhodospirillaceae bacterium]|nr:TIGR00153 family protein [Rhodospirillaceae bacterium]
MAPENPLMQLFGQSPFKPLQEHLRVAIQCANEVPLLFKAVKDGNKKEVEACRERIYQLENQADE